MSEPVGWLRAVVIDTDQPERLGDFWCGVLGVDVADRQEGWLQLTPDKGGVYFAFEARTDPAAVPPRPDIEVTDMDAAQARIEALGGRLVKIIHGLEGETHRRMADPEGNEFTIVLPLPEALQRPDLRGA